MRQQLPEITLLMHLNLFLVQINKLRPPDISGFVVHTRCRKSVAVF